MEPKIVFNISKNEHFKLLENYKTLHRKIKIGMKVEMWVSFNSGHFPWNFLCFLL